jgi:hypothetical protein
MRRVLVALFALAVFLAAVAAGSAGTGNGAPSGPHYNLNLIGVANGKTATDTSNSNGRRIFVPLSGRSRILLTEGPFDVLDYNGTDGEASFQLPNPDPDLDGTTDYSVYVRAFRKPGGSAVLQSCFEDSTGTWCAADFAGGVEPITLGRTKGKQTFQNVTRDRRYGDVCVECDATTGACTKTDQIPLFSDSTKSYLWQYDNDGLRLAQLRFYEVPTVTGF